jgi:hypothetical protein
VYTGPVLPSAAELAQELVSDGEFLALGLGSWLGTADGELISQAVGLVVPPIYRSEYDLLVQGLREAARLQQSQGQRRAGAVALGVVALVAAMLAAARAGNAVSAA